MTSFPTETTLSQSRIESGDETFVTRSYGKKISERDFSKFVCKNFDGFVTRVEPGLGGDVGAPDLFLLSDGLPCLTPAELKLGVVRGNRMYPSEVRPAQCAWWHRYSVSGGVGMLLCHCGSDGVWAVNGMFINDWENGFLITGGEADGAYQISESNFTDSLESFIETELLS